MEKTFKRVEIIEEQREGEPENPLIAIESTETRIDGAGKPYEYSDIVWVDPEKIGVEIEEENTRHQEAIDQENARHDLTMAELQAKADLLNKKK